METIIRYSDLYRRNLNMAGPVILSQIGQITVSLADTMMVGHAGTADLAAASFSNSIFHVGMLFGFGICMGITPLAGRMYSQQRIGEAGSYLKNGIIVNSMAALALTAVMTAVAFFLDQMGQPPEVARKSFPYFLILVASLPPLLLFYSFKQFFEGIGNTRIAMGITLTANAVNIFLNYLLIYGKLGFPEMGLTGAGIATLISRLLMPLMLIPVILRNHKYRPLLLLARHARVNAERMKELLRVGIPIGFQMIVEVLTFSLGAIMMGWHGKESLAAHQVALGLATFSYMISLGVGAGTTIHVSHEFGRANYALLRKTILASVHLVLLFMSCAGLVFILLRQQLPYLFTTDVPVIRIASELLIIAALFQVFDGLQVILLSALRGLADVKIPMLMAFLSYTVTGLPVSYFCSFVFGLGPAGIWLGYLAGLACASALFAFRIKKWLKVQGPV